MFGHQLPQNIYDKLRKFDRLYINQDNGRPRVSNEKDTTTCAVVIHKTDVEVRTITDIERDEMNTLQLPFVFVGSNKDISEAFLPDRFTENHSYINRPFLHGIFDCYSLVRDFYLREWGLWLPANIQRTFGWWDEGENLYVDGAPQYGFEPVNDLKRHDLLVMKFGPVPNHGAIYLGDNKVMHHIGGRFSCVEDLGRKYKQSIAIIYRNRFVEEQLTLGSDHPIEGENA
jgi:cell wall-associated NlpC family hydrolase